MKKDKLDYKHLALISWLMEEPGRRFTSTYMHGRRRGSTKYFRLVNKDAEGRMDLELVYPDPRDNRSYSSSDREAAQKYNIAFLDFFGGNADVDLPYNRNFLNRYGLYGRDIEHVLNKLKEPRDNLFSSEHVYFPNKNMLEYWKEEGKAKFLELKEQREAQRKSVERLVLIAPEVEWTPPVPDDLRSSLPKGVKPPIPRQTLRIPIAVARVVKETSGRLYIQDVEELDVKNGTSAGYSNCISGSAPNQYVSKSDVFVDGISMEEVNKYSNTYKEYIADVNRIVTKEMEEMINTIKNLSNRFDQKKAELEDMIREISDTTSNKPKM